jgi:hypothetical protein
VNALDQLSLAIEHAAPFGIEAAAEFLADCDAGIGGLCCDLLPESAVQADSQGGTP